MPARVYFDACCLNRPFDDQSQARVRLETEAIEHLLRAVEEGKLVWVASEALLFEIRRCPDDLRRKSVLAVCSGAAELIRVTRAAMDRALELRSQGIRDLDALHLACAEAGNVDVVLTTDDRFVAAAKRMALGRKIRVVNPVVYETEVLDE